MIIYVTLNEDLTPLAVHNEPLEGAVEFETDMAPVEVMLKCKGRENEEGKIEIFLPEMPLELAVGDLRRHRDKRLAQTDHLMAPDYPITPEKRAELEKYRQELRDFPENCEDPRNPVWPEKPE